MPKIIDGKSLNIEDVVAVARHGEKVRLADDAVEAIRRCRAMLERKIEAREVMYGVNTGIGELSEVALDDDQVREFQHLGQFGLPGLNDLDRCIRVDTLRLLQGRFEIGAPGMVLSGLIDYDPDR